MPDQYQLESYDFHLPEHLIAQAPAARRDGSRLLVIDCSADTIADRRFPDLLEHLSSDDLLVVNDTKVFPARLRGRKESGGKVELLLLEFPQNNSQGGGGDWQEASACGLLRSSKRPKPGSTLLFGEDLQAVVEEDLPGGKAKFRLRYRGNLPHLLEQCGGIPLPPYIRREEESAADRDRYQTIYAAHTGAVAAPTAGLHFTPDLLAALRQKGVQLAALTLHVGYGTFAPVRAEDIRQHQIHAEHLTIPSQTAQLVNETKAKGGKIWAIGTTTARSLEFAAAESGRITPLHGWCDLYIYPGYRFKVVDNLITNFHLPRSSLLFMVSALAGRERIVWGYQQAIALNYRFYSYGDAMAILT